MIGILLWCSSGGNRHFFRDIRILPRTNITAIPFLTLRKTNIHKTKTAIGRYSRYQAFLFLSTLPNLVSCVRRARESRGLGRRSIFILTIAILGSHAKSKPEGSPGRNRCRPPLTPTFLTEAETRRSYNHERRDRERRNHRTVSGWVLEKGCLRLDHSTQGQYLIHSTL